MERHPGPWRGNKMKQNRMSAGHPVLNNMEAAYSSDLAVSVQKTTRCRNQEDHNLNNHRRENVRIYIRHEVYTVLL
jgi:hypothetical protein